MNDEVSQGSTTPNDFNKHYAIIFLLVVIVFIHLPSLILSHIWIENGLSKNDFVVCVFVPCLQLYLMLLCPIAFACVKPGLAICDYIWCRWTREEFVNFPFLVIGVFIVITVAYTFARIVHPTQSATYHFYSDHGTIFLVWLVIRRVLLSPVIEEFFWRGYAQGTLTKIFRPWIAILGQSLLFGLVHFVPLVDTVRPN